MAKTLDRETLVRRHHVGVWRYLRFLGADRALADDLTQETFLVFLRKPFNFMGHESTAGYLRGIARFVWLEERRNTVTTAEQCPGTDAPSNRRWALRARTQTDNLMRSFAAV